MDDLDPAQRRALRKQERESRARQAENDSVIQSLMRTPLGRRWMKEKLEVCHVFQTSYKGEAAALAMAFAEGERNIGLMLLNDVMVACPEAYVLMMGENSGRRTDDRRDLADPDDERNWDGDAWIGSGEDPRYRTVGPDSGP